MTLSVMTEPNIGEAAMTASNKYIEYQNNVYNIYQVICGITLCFIIQS